MSKRITIIKSVLCLSFLLFLSNTVLQATSIDVVPIILDVNSAPQMVSRDITVKNLSNEKAYIAVTPKVLLNPGTKNATLEEIKNPKKYGVLVTPRKMIIPAKSNRVVRVVILAHKQSVDNVFRVIIEPKTSAQYFGTDEKTKGIKILIGYSALLIVRPKDAHANINLKRSGTELTITNSGNSNALLYDAKQCSGAKQCEKLDFLHRVYAGETYNLKLPKAAPVEMMQLFKQKRSQLKSN